MSHNYWANPANPITRDSSGPTTAYLINGPKLEAFLFDVSAYLQDQDSTNRDVMAKLDSINTALAPINSLVQHVLTHHPDVVDEWAKTQQVTAELTAHLKGENK